MVLVVVLAVAAAVGAGIAVFRYYFAPRTVASVLALYGRDARARLKPAFARAHVAYPPKRLALLIFKNERRVASAACHVPRAVCPGRGTRHTALSGPLDRRSRGGTLVADTGYPSVKVIIAPNDLRVRPAPAVPSMPSWVPDLYRTIAAALVPFPVWMESSGAIDVTGHLKVKSIAP